MGRRHPTQHVILDGRLNEQTHERYVALARLWQRKHLDVHVHRLGDRDARRFRSIQ